MKEYTFTVKIQCEPDEFEDLEETLTDNLSELEFESVDVTKVSEIAVPTE
jgi:hypothetical protein